MFPVKVLCFIYKDKTKEPQLALLNSEFKKQRAFSESFQIMGGIDNDNKNFVAELTSFSRQHLNFALIFTCYKHKLKQYHEKLLAEPASNSSQSVKLQYSNGYSSIKPIIDIHQ